MSLLEMIGKTPLVKLEDHGSSAIYAKLEYKNPSGSIKDRIAQRMVRDAEKSGKLIRGMEIIEASSGNTGISLSMVGSNLGYDVTIAVPVYATQGARSMIKNYGAGLIESDAYISDCLRRLSELRAENPGHYYFTDQARNPSVLMSNEDLGNEIVKGLRVDTFIASVGTGATITGVSKSIKKANPDAVTCAVLPDGKYRVPGVDDYRNDNLDRALLDQSLIDEEVRITEKEAILAARKLNNELGHYVGVSSGAVFAAAKKIAEEGRGNILVVLVDSGNRYKNVL